MTTQAPTPGWAVLLQGHAFDLEIWKQRLQPPFDPWVEYEKRPEEDEAYLLRSHSFAQIGSHEELRTAARPMLEWLNGLMLLEVGAEPVMMGPAVLYEADGRRQRFLWAEVGVFTARVSATISMTVIKADGTEITVQPEPVSSRVQSAFKLAVADDDVADLLEHLSRSDNDWYEIYKTLEVAKRIAKRFASAKGKKDAFKGVFSERLTEFELVWRTANCHRHSASADHLLPSNPPTLGEARGLVVWAVGELIKRVRSAPP